jgi:hypothetical protein
MSRTTQRFIVEIVTEDSITDDNKINEMAQNIGDAIIYLCDIGGITPEDSETHTKIVYVRDTFSITSDENKS